jgi:23S rRNA (adenine1618-N6)-methyltransferase
MVEKESTSNIGKGKHAPAEKSGMHPRNAHRKRYDFKQLVSDAPELSTYVFLNEYGDESIDFSSPAAVKALNRALLIQTYGIQSWDIPEQYLSPPIPGRADYLHYLADLLASLNDGVIPLGGAIRVLDIGVGANCIYPLIGQHEYGWDFVGSDIDQIALANSQGIIEANRLSEKITLRKQALPGVLFQGVIKQFYALSLCNPPFHSSLAEARSGTQRKWKNLGVESNKKKIPVLNFGGQSMELCCEGGEEAFVCRMITESMHFSSHCLWFTSLISKSSSLPGVYRAIKQSGAVENRTIEMTQGQKKSRIVAWTFFDAKQQRDWLKARSR